MPEGTERMSEIASAIRVGANAFINYEYRILAIVVGTIAAVMAIVTTWHAAVALLLGSFMSASAGFIGMKIATYANVRVSNKAKESRSIGATVKVAFQGGSVMGLCVAGCALLGLFIVYLVFGLGLGQLSVTEGSYTNLLGTVVAGAYGFFMTWGILWVVNKFLKVRVSEVDETLGLDEAISHEKAYRFE